MKIKLLHSALQHILVIALFLLLSGCGVLPGMQNLETSGMEKAPITKSIPIKPIFQPISASYLATLRNSQFEYHVAAQDVLQISVWQHPELNTSEPNLSAAMNTLNDNYVINGNGKIYFPLAGYVSVANKTVDQVRQSLAQRLQNYVRNPQVLVRVTEYRSQKVYVMGEVLKPGILPLTDQPMSLTDALNLAGSLDPNASDPRYIYVLRGNVFRPTIYWLNAGSPSGLILAERFRLQNQDIVIVSTAMVARWNRFLNQLLPTLQTVWYTKAITGK